jgi:hypothetical protein
MTTLLVTPGESVVIDHLKQELVRREQHIAHQDLEIANLRDVIHARNMEIAELRGRLCKGGIVKSGALEPVNRGTQC